MKNQPKISMHSVPELYASRALQPTFGALPSIKIKLMIVRWKALDVGYPTQVEFFNLELICPSKISFSQKYFLLVQKVAERWFSWCFGPFDHPELEEMLWSYWSERVDALRVGLKNLFWDQKFPKWQKFLQICWNSERRSPIMPHAQPRKPRPRF